VLDYTTDSYRVKSRYYNRWKGRKMQHRRSSSKPPEERLSCGVLCGGDNWPVIIDNSGLDDLG
jgi:hypothetical protein